MEKKNTTTLILDIVMSVSSSILSYEKYTMLLYQNVNITYLAMWWKKDIYVKCPNRMAWNRPCKKKEELRI